jgi:glutathionyl-hydroquinone reductase
VSIVRAYPKGDSKGWPGWKFPANEQEYEGATVDKLFGSEYLHEVYFKDDKDYKGRYSVPLLWDKKTNRIVNNVGQPDFYYLKECLDNMFDRKVQKF